MTSVTIPTLKTERLVLRGLKPQDFEPLVTFFADEARCWGFGGVMDRNQTWRYFASLYGHWELRGYGYWMVDTHGGDTVGMVGLWHPEGYAEPELSWLVFEGAEGKGIAHEAALAVRDYAYDTLGWRTLTSLILPGNARSEALAKRMGATFEKTITNLRGVTDQVFRHPAADAHATAEVRS